MNEVNDTRATMDENGMFDIADDRILATIAGGLSESVAVLDNHCTTNDSKCGASK